MDPSYVQYITQTLISINYASYGSFLCTLIMHQSARDQPSHAPVHNMDPYIDTGSALTMALYYVLSLCINQPGVNQATPLYITWTYMCKTQVVYTFIVLCRYTHLCKSITLKQTKHLA